MSQAQSDYVASVSDELDLALERCVASLGPGCLGGVPLTRAGKGYKLGSKRLLLRLDGQELKVRQGSTWPSFAEWLPEEVEAQSSAPDSSIFRGLDASSPFARHGT